MPAVFKINQSLEWAIYAIKSLCSENCLRVKRHLKPIRGQYILFIVVYDRYNKPFSYESD